MLIWSNKDNAFDTKIGEDLSELHQPTKPAISAVAAVAVDEWLSVIPCNESSS